MDPATDTERPSGPSAPLEDRNEVHVRGRLSGTPERRVLPSGDEIVSLRIVVRRPGSSTVDTLPVTLGPAPGPGRRAATGQVGRRVLAAAERVPGGATVDIRGRLHRRWWAAGGARRSRVEIEAARVEVVEG